MKYFIPEWNDRVDPKYHFLTDTHSTEHNQDPAKNDFYMWDIFGMEKLPFDGVLVSRIPMEQDKKKYKQVQLEGIHKTLRLPSSFKILGDCGAFGYVSQKKPPYDTIEILEYYKKTGFDYGVTVDHLVTPQFESEKDERMKITRDNAIKAFEEWSKHYRNDFQLILAVQGWKNSDYLDMYREYVNIGATHIALGGLVRSTTTEIAKLVSELTEEVKKSDKVPKYIHFFGLARIQLFPLFEKLEETGVEVGFDSASYLRKAWLAAASSQNNYVTTSGKGYTAIRVPLIARNLRRKNKKNPKPQIEKEIQTIEKLEQECLTKLRHYDQNKISSRHVITSLSEFAKVTGKGVGLEKFYARTLKDKAWKNCDCPICSEVGIEVAIFRSNNRNRRRGFHNVNVFYQILQNKELWKQLIAKETPQEIALEVLQKGEKVLIITGCSKEKLSSTNNLKSSAETMYQGRLFKKVREYSKTKGFDYVIISAKYGLLFPDQLIYGYEKVLKKDDDIKSIQPIVEDRLQPLLKNYDKIVVIAGQNYRKVLENLWDERFSTVKGRGYGDLCSIVTKATPNRKPLTEFYAN